MSEPNKQEEKLMVCKYYLHSICQNGEYCEYAHYMTDILPKDVMCEYYIRGCCKYGKKCWSSHGQRRKKEKDTAIEKRGDSGDKIKRRFSLSLNYIRRKRAEELIREQSIRNLPKSLTNMFNLKYYDENIPTVKLPMDSCEHFRTGQCDFGFECPCLHGKFCDYCQKYCLDPSDEDQQKQHTKECIAELEKDMEFSFAIQCSLDKVCGICLEVVIEKEDIAERRFGILEKCNHVFCLSCIREWRKRVRLMDAMQEDMDEPIIDPRLLRACPSCRVQSDFVTPSKYWFFTETEKAERITQYKSNLKEKQCKYFEESESCPFGNECFYRHARPDGTLVELPSPKKRPRRNRPRQATFVDDNVLWNYLNEENDEDIYFIEDDDNYILVHRGSIL